MTIRLVRVETVKPEDGEKQIAALEARGFEYVGTAINQHGAVAVVTMRRDDRTAGQVAISQLREMMARAPMPFADTIAEMRADRSSSTHRGFSFDELRVINAARRVIVGDGPDLRIVDPADEAEQTEAKAAPATPTPFVLNTDTVARAACFPQWIVDGPHEGRFTAEDKHMRALVLGKFVRGTERLYTAAPPNPSPPTLAEFAKFANDYPAVLSGVAVQPTGEGDDAQSNVAITGVSLDLERLGGDIDRMRCFNDFRALTRTATSRDDTGTVIHAAWATE